LGVCCHNLLNIGTFLNSIKKRGEKQHGKPGVSDFRPNWDLFWPGPLTQSLLERIFLSMEIFRPLRAALFIYECLRLLVLIRVFSVLRPGGGEFPWLVYAAPNVLFPLMTLFLWRFFSRCGAYAPLYTAGKSVALVSIAAFCVFSWQSVFTGFFLRDPGVFLILGSLAFLLVGDLLSVAGGAVLAGKVRKVEEADRSETAGVPATGALPAEAAGNGGGL
jgi:hypothetical protein